MASPRVALIIVNWNGLEYLKGSLPTLAAQDYRQLTVYVVDNNSSDDSVSYIKKKYPKTVIIDAKYNRGFAGGNNLGLKQAMDDGADYFFLLNNDTEVEPDMISKMVKYMEDEPKVGIAQPKLILMDYRDTLDSCGSWMSKTGFLIHHGCEEKDGPAYSKVMPLLTIKGAAMIVRRDLLEKIGLFDDDFFAYFEETDLCWRAWLAGYKVHYAPVTNVYHKMGGSAKKIGSPVVNFHSFKNRIMSLIKNLEWYNVIWMVPLHLILVLGFSFIYFLAGRFKSGASIYRAIGWNIAHFGSTLAKRRAIQSSRVIRDKELFKIIIRPIDWMESFDFSRRYFVEKTKSDLIAAGKWKGRQ